MRRGALRRGALLVGVLAAGACGGGDAPAAPVESAPAAPYSFRDATAESGLAAFVQVNGGADKPFIVETIGAGVALLDHDGDGDLDAYLANGSRLGDIGEGDEPRDALFANDGAGRFSDVTARCGLGSAGWTNGVSVVDVEGDGWPDVFLTCYGPNVLYVNAGEGIFRDATAEAGLGDPRWSAGACFLDHDRDGDLDLYVANYVDFDEERMLAERPTFVYKGIEVMKGPRGLPGSRDVFYVNDGPPGPGSTGGTPVFRDASAEVGIDGPVLYGLECVAFDADEDGWVDVYVANDSVENLLWRNEPRESPEGARRFTDVALRSGLAFSMSGRPQAGMGIGLGDYDGDLRVDLYVTNFADDYHTLYRGAGNGFFVDATQRMKLSEPTKSLLGWSCGFADFDSDGDLEVWAVNGHVYPQVDLFDLGTSYRQPNQVFELVDGAFRLPPGGGGPGLAIEKASRGAALGDVDDDGDLDLLIGNIDDTPTLLVNDGPNGNRIRVRLVGAGANRDAIGARVVARSGERRMLRLVGTGGGFLSSSEPILHFGLGAAAALDELEVRWPDGGSETFRDLPAGVLVRIEEGAQGAGRSRVTTVPPGKR